jgi:repressor of nif and glnA expression
MKKSKKQRVTIKMMMIDILKKSKIPLHYREITKRLIARGYKFHRKEPERSVYITIKRNPKLFKKVKPATFKFK